MLNSNLNKLKDKPTKIKHFSLAIKKWITIKNPLKMKSKGNLIKDKFYFSNQISFYAILIGKLQMMKAS